MARLFSSIVKCCFTCMCLLAMLHHTHLLRSASTVLTPGGALSHQLHMFRSTNNASSDLTAEITGVFPRSDARLHAPQTSAQLMALAPSSSVCAKDSRVSGHDFVWADRELILVGAVHPLLGSLAARLLEHALPCAILIGAETGSLPSKEAKLSVTTSKKSTDANRKATALGIARLSMRGGAQEAKRRSKAFEQSVKDEDRKRFGQVELAKETAARAHLAVEDAFVLASRDTAPGDPLPLSVVNAHAPEQFFGYEKNAPAAEMLPAKESELAQALLTRWQARWQLHDHNSTARLPRQIIAASPSAIALASTVHKSFQSAADRHPLGLQFADIAPRFVFVLCHPVTYAFDKGFSALEDREGEVPGLPRNREKNIDRLSAMGVNRNDAAEIEALEWAQARLIASKLQQWMRAAHEVSRLLQKLRCIAIQGEALIGDLSTATAIATLVAGPVVGEEIQAAATVGRTAPSSHQGVTQTSDHELMTSGDIILRDSHLRIVCWRSGKGYMQLERRCDKATDRAFQVSNSYVRSIRDEYFGELRARHAGWAAVFGYSFVSTSVNAPARSEETRGTAEVFMVSPSLTKPTPSVLTDHIVHPLRQPPTTRVAGNHQVGDTHAAHNDENMLDESGRPPLEGKDVLFIYHQLWPEGGNHGGMFERMTDLVWAAHELGARVHFVCHCDIGSGLATSWAPEGTLFYFGPLRQQLDEVRIANGRTEVPAADAVQVQTKRDVSPSWKLEAVFHFYTSLTLTVNRRSIENPTWFVEPGDDWFVWDTAFDLVSAMGPSVNVIVTDDVHHRRVVQAMKEQPRHQIEQAVEWMRSHELQFYSRADVVATVSPEDATLISDLLRADRARTPSLGASNPLPPTLWIPFVAPRLVSPDEVPALSARSGLFFVGVPHKLAVHALQWFIAEVHPRLVAQLRVNRVSMSHANTYIGGGDNLAKTKWDSLRRAASASPHAAQLHLLGGLSDEQVETHFAQRRVFIAPLFNSTGIATKIVNSMGHGLPVTTTSDGIRGLGFISAKNDTSGEVPIDQTLCVANDADAFASCLCKLLMDDDAWTQASSAGLKHISHVLSPSAQRRSMRDAVLRRPLEKTEPDRKRG